VDAEFTGLRCQDVNLGLRSGETDSWVLSVVDNTQLVGMAADLAGLLRGRNVVENVDALKIVANEALDIDVQVLPSVLTVLEECGFIEIARTGPRISQIIETIPAFRSLYPELGNAWQQRRPRQIEEELVAVVHRLAKSPIPVEELGSAVGIDTSDADHLYHLGHKAALFRIVDTIDGSILYSPYSAFEDPEAMRTALTNHGPAELADSIQQVSQYQGFPVDPDTDPVLADAVALGLLAAPSVALPNGTLRSFAALPYTVDRDLLTVRKAILDKALAIVACVRCGQHFGGATRAANVVAVLDALVNRESLAAHSSHERQYKLLRDQGIIRFLPDTMPGGRWKRPALIKTEENLEAVAIARSLVLNEDLQAGREASSDVRNLLDLDAKALRPLQTTGRSRRTNTIDPAKLDIAFEALMGRAAK
jgi:hypothetical protein